MSFVIVILSRVNVFNNVYLETLTLFKIIFVECSSTNSETTFFKVPLSVPHGFFFAVNNVRQFLHFNLPSSVFQNFVFKQLGHFILLRIIMKFYHFQVHFLNFTLLYLTQKVNKLGL